MGRKEKTQSVKNLRINRSVFIDIGTNDKEKVLKNFNVKCWRESNKTGKSFVLRYDKKNGLEVIRIKRVKSKRPTKR